MVVCVCMHVPVSFVNMCGVFVAAQDKVVQLESELARLQLGGREEEEGEGERRSAEERLKAIIRQCELCVKREQMLKQLGV